MRPKLPGELWLGMIEGQWPVYAFVGEGHAANWVKEPTKNGQRKFVWHVEELNAMQLELISPAPVLFREIEDDLA
jgi:hypothetical protein